MTQEQVIEMLERTGALLSGHFKLSSGLHSDKYVQCAKLLQYPELARRLGTELANRLRDSGFTLPEVVASPALGGIIIGHEVAAALGVRHIFVEKDSQGKPVLRRGFSIAKGANFVVVEDVVTTGRSTAEVIDLLMSMGGEPVAVLAIVDRTGGKEPLFKAPFISLVTLDFKVYEPENCPLCAQGVPIEKPGSRWMKNNSET